MKQTVAEFDRARGSRQGDELDVCVVTTIHSPFDARIYERGIRVLAEAGLRVGFVGPWPYAADSGVWPSDWRTTQQPASRRSRPLHGWRTLRAALRVKARVFHFHDLDFLPWALVLQMLTSAHVVYDVHENYPEDIRYHKEYIPRFLRSTVAAVVRMAERFAASRFSAVVVVVPHLEARFAPIARRTVLVRNFSRLEPRPDLPHAPALLYAGGITRFYGAMTLLEIGRELNRRGSYVRLVVADKFTEAALRPLFVDTIKTENLPIDIVPVVPSSQLQLLMTRGSIGLVPDEPSPTAHLGLHAKFFDYMAMGLPIVASDIENARNLLTFANCGVLVPPSDARAFVDASLRLLENPGELHRLRENGITAFRASFSWTIEVAKLTDLMRQLAKRSSSSAT